MGRAIFCICAERSTEKEGKPFKLSVQDLKIRQEEKLCETFRTVLGQQHTNVGNEFYIVNLNPKENFESYVLELSNSEASKVKVAIEGIFRKLADIYKEYEKLLGKTESSYHGFVYGFLAMNFKYRYNLDCYVERIEGKGYTDLVLISRKGDKRNKNWNVIPVVVEFKAKDETVEKAIKQIKDRGYLYTPLTMRTSAEQGVIVGVNFALNPPVITKEEKIYQSQGFINELLNGINDLLKATDNERRDNIKNYLKEKIEKEIEYLYFAASGVRIENYLSRLILGQMLATEVPNGSKHIFIHNDKYLSFYDGKNEVIVKSGQISTFLIKKQSKALVFNIIEYQGTGIPVTRNKKPVRFEGRYFFYFTRQ